MIAAALLGLAGCPVKPKYETLPSVRITSPMADTIYTNGSVRITAAIEPALGLPIRLRRDGAEVATLLAPAYAYVWDTTKAVEAAYVVTAEIDLSNGTLTSDPITIVVDRTPPAIVRSPAPGAAGVMLRAPIQAGFSEPIILSRSPEATFGLASDGSIVPTRVTLDARKQTATIGIDDPGMLPLPTRLSATIAGPITDRAGNAMTLPADDWFWDVPAFVELPAVAVDASLPPTTRLPAFAVGSDLLPVLATASSDTGGGGITWQVQVRKYGGAGWHPVAPPSNDPDSASRGVALAVGGAQPFVAWRPSTPGADEIDVAAGDGALWERLPRVALAEGDASSIVVPILRVGPDQAPAILWSTGDRAFLARRTLAGWNQSFGSIPIATSVPFAGDHLDMILDDAGNPIVSSIDASGTAHVSRWTGGAWTAAPDSPDVDEPWLALDERGQPMLGATGEAGAILVQRLDGGAWRLLPPAAVPPQAKHPRIAAGPSGLPVVAYYDAQTSAIGMARWTGQRWDTRAFAFANDAIDQTPQIVVDHSGTAWIGWRDATRRFNVWMSNF